MLRMAPQLASFSRPSAYSIGPLVLAPLLLGVLAACAVRVEPEQPAYPPAKLDSTQIHSARTFLAAARNERAADNMPAAERLLKGLLEVHPYYAGAYTELVSLQLEVGNLSRAREALDGGLAIDPGNAELRRLEGAYFLASGDLDAALERYSDLAKRDKLVAKAQLNLALVQVMRGEDADALATLAGPLGASRAKEKLAQLQQLRNQSGERPMWEPKNGPGEVLLADVESESAANAPESPVDRAAETEPMAAAEPEFGGEPGLTDEMAAAQAADETLARLEAALDAVESEVDGLEAPMASADDPAEEPMEEPVIEEWSSFDEERSVAALTESLGDQTGTSGEAETEAGSEPESDPEPAAVQQPEEDPVAALADEPLGLEPIELGNPSTNPLAGAKLDAPTVVAPQLPEEPAASAEDGPAAVVLAEPEPEPEVPATPFVSSEWRGLAKSKIGAYGSLAVQQLQGVEVRMLPDGAHTVTVEPHTPGPVWVMGPKSDWLLSPNARIRIQKDGSVFAGSGEREEFPIPAGRAKVEDVWR